MDNEGATLKGISSALARDRDNAGTQGIRAEGTCLCRMSDDPCKEVEAKSSSFPTSATPASISDPDPQVGSVRTQSPPSNQQRRMADAAERTERADRIERAERLDR